MKIKEEIEIKSTLNEKIESDIKKLYFTIWG